MRVFVAGATGILGRRTIPLLLEAGHEVTAIARSEARAELLRTQGAQPIAVSLFDPEALRNALGTQSVVCNLATHIPPLSKMAFPRSWEENNRIRTEGSRSLVDAALHGNVVRYVQESIAFVYEDNGDRWIDESGPRNVPAYVRSVNEAEAQAWRFTHDDPARTGVILRFGLFYAPDSQQTAAMVRFARWRMGALPGPPDGYTSNIHVDDAAAAVVAALDVPNGPYNIVEDDPLTRREQLAALGSVVGVKRLRPPPAFLVRLGGGAIATIARSQRISNRKFRQATGWRPAFPSVREGWPAVVSEMPR